LTCPITGKTCYKHKAYSVTEKKGEEQHSYAVCEDCVYMNGSLSFDDELGPCPFCGETLEAIVKASRIGCAKCYDHFDEPLSHMIAAVQASPGFENKHTGSVPRSYKQSVADSTTAVRFATELSQKIRIAQREEKYEVASAFNEILFVVKGFISRANDLGELLPEDKAKLSQIVYEHMFPESI